MLSSLSGIKGDTEDLSQHNNRIAADGMAGVGEMRKLRAAAEYDR